MLSIQPPTLRSRRIQGSSNNEYQVMVVATDRGLKATRSVVVRVTNVNEPGKIELTPEAPTVGHAGNGGVE